MSEAPALEAENLSVSFGGVRAVAGVSLRLDAGEILGVIFFALVPEFLRGFVQAQYIVFGTLLVLFMAFLPNGLASAGALFRRRASVR